MTVRLLRRHEAGEAGAAAAAAADPRALARSIDQALAALVAQQRDDGHWCYEFEADCTIPAEFILMSHYMDEIDEGLERRMARYIRAKQAEHGGWPLYPGGEFNLSCSVKAYYALKLVGDSPDEAHMQRARAAILAAGGAVRANVFTHISLALFEQVPWSGVPFIPVEILLLPDWFPFHVYKVSYWSRTVMVPLFVLTTLKPKARNPRAVHVRELFTTPPERETGWFPIRSPLNRLFNWLDRLGRAIEPLVPKAIRRRALRVAERWVVERLNGDDGLGAIFPAMVNAHEMLDALGYEASHPYRRMTRAALDKLVIDDGETAYCQPCMSPVWDTALAVLTLQEAGADPDICRAGLDWLAERQLCDQPGDWQYRRPGLRGGGWPFQYGNSHYPDIDDTPVVGWGMLSADPQRYALNMEHAAEWIAGMQSSNGGWASFDVDNIFEYLNEIPFADHGALLDPPTSDVTARCVAYLSLLDRRRFATHISRALEFLRAEQEPEGCWFGRWGSNYIYGTWSVLLGLAAAGVPDDEEPVRRAVAWLLSVQRTDGGWGESNDSYGNPHLRGLGAQSTPHQTAWAVLGLLAAGEVDSTAVRRGVDWLLAAQEPDGQWSSAEFTAPGFPRVFYLKYHGYTKYFPLWALARYRNLTRTNP